MFERVFKTAHQNDSQMAFLILAYYTKEPLNPNVTMSGFALTGSRKICFSRTLLVSDERDVEREREREIEIEEVRVSEKMD